MQAGSVAIEHGIHEKPVVRAVAPTEWRNAPLAPVIRDAEPRELALLRSRHRTLRLIDLQPQLRGHEPAHRGHDPFAGAVTTDINVAVVRVPAEAVTTTGQLLVETVEEANGTAGLDNRRTEKGTRLSPCFGRYPVSPPTAPETPGWVRCISLMSRH
jgi:hypothetical protein